MLVNDLKFGSDPEFFAYNAQLGVISPALLEEFSGVPRIGGDNKHPEFIHTDKYIWMGDGVAHELTLKQPYDLMVDMHRTIGESLKHLEEHLSKIRFNNKVLKIRAKPVAKINPELYTPYLEKESIFMGFIYGCDPDEDAFMPNYNCKTKDASRDLFRYAGGHLHFSSKEHSGLFEKFPRIAIKLLAVSVGNYVTYNSKFPTLEKKRVGTYGRPGRFRKQHYKNDIHGVEYRTPSVTWTTFTEYEIEEMEELARKALELFVAGASGDKRVKYIMENLANPTVNAINKVDQYTAKRLVESFKSL